MEHPEYAARPCEMCQTYWFERDGKLHRDRHGNPLRRPPRLKVPCQYPKHVCPKGVLGNAVEWQPWMQGLYDYYYRCRATGRFPDDLLIEECSGWILAEETESERRQQAGLIAFVRMLAEMSIGSKI